MEQRNNLVYVQSRFINGFLQDYCVIVDKPVWHFLQDVEYYKKQELKYIVDDFTLGRKVEVRTIDANNDIRRDLFICNELDINEYLYN